MLSGRYHDDVARCAHPGIDHGNVHRTGWKIAKGPREPEARLGRPMDDDFVREVNDSCIGKATQYAALHHAHEWALMPEVSGDRDDSGGVRRAHNVIGQ